MKNYAAWLCIVTACTLGCRSIARRTQPEAYVASYLPAAQLASPEPAAANESTPEVTLVEPDAVRAIHEGDEQPLQNSESAEGESKSKALEKDKQAAADADAFGARCASAARKLSAVVINAQAMIRHAIIAMQKANEKAVEEKKAPPLQPEKLPVSDQAPERDVSRTVLYCVASIWGTLFTCIFAPLVLDFLRQRIGIGRHQAEMSKLVQAQAIQAERKPGANMLPLQATRSFNWPRNLFDEGKYPDDLAFLVLVKHVSKEQVSQFAGSGDPATEAGSAGESGSLTLRELPNS